MQHSPKLELFVIIVCKAEMPLAPLRTVPEIKHQPDCST